MATINREELLGHLLIFLPESNVLEDEELMELAVNRVVDYEIPMDDEIHYSEALCKALKVAGLINLGRASVDRDPIKREKVGQIEKETHGDLVLDSWQRFIDSLKDTCPHLPKGGYSPSSKIGIKISSGKPIQLYQDC